MLSYSILQEEGIVVIEPEGPITRQDLETMSRDVDTYLEQRGTIKGLIVHTRSFPRWADLGAFLRDMMFVLDHRSTIERVASVTDSRLLAVVHYLAGHIFSPEIRHFDYGDVERARQWIREE